MHFLGRVALAGRWQWVAAAGGPAAEGQLKPGAAEPGRSWTPPPTSGRPRRECVCDQPGRDLEIQHQKTDPTRSLEATRGREGRIRIFRGFFSSPDNLGYLRDRNVEQAPPGGWSVVLIGGRKVSITS